MVLSRHPSVLPGMHIYILSGTDIGWEALVRSWEKWWQWTDKCKAVVFTGFHNSCRFLIGSLMSCPFFSVSWPHPKGKNRVSASCSLWVESPLGAHGSQEALWEPRLSEHRQNVCSASSLTNFGSIIILPVLMWYCLCLSQHSETGTARFCIMTATELAPLLCIHS